MVTGRTDPTHPSIGAWVSYGLGTENRDLPGFVSLGGASFGSARSGYLPGEHQGTTIRVERTAPSQMIRHLKNPRIDLASQEKQLEFLRSMNAPHLADRGLDPLLEARMRAMETAFRMQTAAPRVFDIRQETKATRDLYGEGAFADSCLLARRLVENGVRFVQVNNGGWDHHENINQEVAKKSREIDQPIAALLTDLKQRGLLDETLVLWGGEFGRTPVSENGDGRDHNPHGFTVFLAGGGVRGGTIHGATDEFGFRAVENRVSVHDLHATMLHLLGIDHERLTYRYSGRDFRLTDVAGEVAAQASILAVSDSSSVCRCSIAVEKNKSLTWARNPGKVGFGVDRLTPMERAPGPRPADRRSPSSIAVLTIQTMATPSVSR